VSLYNNNNYNYYYYYAAVITRVDVVSTDERITAPSSCQHSDQRSRLVLWVPLQAAIIRTHHHRLLSLTHYKRNSIPRRVEGWVDLDATVMMSKALYRSGKHKLLTVWFDAGSSHTGMLPLDYYRLGMDGYPFRLSGSGRISNIWQNLTAAWLQVSRRIRSVLIIRDLAFDFSEIWTSFVKFEFVLQDHK